MSSFVILTQSGPPDLIVEVGKPISSDPILLSGLFKAIMSFTDEVAQAPLQVLQAKGFTVQFKNIFNDYLLIVGTDHYITGLELILRQIEMLVKDGFENNYDKKVIEKAIEDVLHNYVEASQRQSEDGHSILLTDTQKKMFADIPPETYKILFFALLTGYRLRYPKTGSLDLNHNLVKFIEYLGFTCCSDLDPECADGVTINSRKETLIIKDREYKVKQVIQKTQVLKDLNKLVKKKKFFELKVKLRSELSTLLQLERVFLAFDEKKEDPKEQERISHLRYMLGPDLEYYLLLRLQKRNPQLVEYLQEKAIQTEWINDW